MVLRLDTDSQTKDCTLCIYVASVTPDVFSLYIFSPKVLMSFIHPMSHNIGKAKIP